MKRWNVFVIAASADGIDQQLHDVIGEIIASSSVYAPVCAQPFRPVRIFSTIM